MGKVAEYFKPEDYRGARGIAYKGKVSGLERWIKDLQKGENTKVKEIVK